MSNMPNAQQVSAVSQGAQASIGEANRMASVREQMRGQQAMQQQSIKARSAEAEKERGFQAQRDQQQMGLEQQKMAQSGQLAQQRMAQQNQQFSQSHGLAQQQLAEQKRVQQYEEGEAAKDKQLAAMQFKLQQKALRATASQKQAIRQQMVQIRSQRSDIAAKMAKTKMMQGLTEQEFRQRQETLPAMEAQIKTLRTNAMSGGESIANYVTEEMGNQSAVRARDSGRWSTHTILGFETGDIPMLGESLREAQGKAISEIDARGLFGVSNLDDPDKAGSIYKQLEGRTEEMGSNIAQDSLVPAFAEALSRQSNISQDDARQLSKVVFEAITNNEDTDLSKLIQESTAKYGINGLVMSNAISTMANSLEEKSIEMELAASSSGDPTYSDTSLGFQFAGENGIPTQEGMLGLYGAAIGGLAQKMKLATMATEHMNTNFDTMLDALSDVRSMNFSDVTSGMRGGFDAQTRKLLIDSGVDLDSFNREERQLLDAIVKSNIQGNLSEGFGREITAQSALDRTQQELIDDLTGQITDYDPNIISNPVDLAEMERLIGQ